VRGSDPEGRWDPAARTRNPLRSSVSCGRAKSGVLPPAVKPARTSVSPGELTTRAC